MRHRSLHKLNTFDEGELQGLMIGGFESGTELKLPKGHRMICLDGDVWEIETSGEKFVCLIRPENCTTSDELLELIAEQLEHRR